MKQPKKPLQPQSPNPGKWQQEQPQKKPLQKPQVPLNPEKKW
jgi:hypothetical protein